MKSKRVVPKLEPASESPDPSVLVFLYDFVLKNYYLPPYANHQSAYKNFLFIKVEAGI